MEKAPTNQTVCTAWERDEASCWQYLPGQIKIYKPFPRSLSAADSKRDTALLSCRPIGAMLAVHKLHSQSAVSVVLQESNLGFPGTAGPDCTSPWDYSLLKASMLLSPSQEKRNRQSNFSSESKRLLEFSFPLLVLVLVFLFLSSALCSPLW